MIAGREVLLELVKKGLLRLDPYDPGTIRENGVDLRLGGDYCRLRESRNPLDLSSEHEVSEYYECGRAGENGILLEPRSAYLLETMEYVEMPPGYAGLVNLRSTWARAGILVPPTVVDAGFKGRIVVEAWTGPYPVRLHPGQRFLHLVLVRVVGATPYQGKYQGQNGIVLPRPDPA